MELFLLLLLIVVFILFVGFRKKSASKPHAAKTESLLVKHKELFDNLFPNPLTQEQRLSIVDDSYRTLVIASAGSGKTTTLVSKYAFLLAEELAAPKEILVLAFNKAIEQELLEKIKKLIPGSGNPEVYTFHGFGLELLNKAEGRKKVDILAESSSDGLLDTANVLGIIEMAKNRYPKIEERISEFRAECPFHQIEEFARNEREYNEAVTSYPYKRELFRAGGEFRPRRIPSLDTRYWVRSQQELTILNSLVMKGVKVEYERPHPDGEITPDFYYPEIDLWHEHFAINRNGNSPFPGYVETFQKKKRILPKAGQGLSFHLQLRVLRRHRT